MSKKINIGVFPCGSEVGLEINRSLKYYKEFNLIGLNSTRDYSYLSYSDYIEDLPFIHEDTFFEKLVEIINDREIRYLIPAMDEVGYLLKKNEKKICCEIVYPEFSIAEILRRKSSTYKKLKNILNTPNVYSDLDEIEKKLPVFIKPDIGYGSRGAKKIKNLDELHAELDRSQELLIMEYLPGDEFTVDCFSDSNGKLLFAGARIRQRVRMGISVSTKKISNEKKFNTIAKRISEELKMSGVWFFQLKEDKNKKLTLLEVGGRVSGSMALYRGMGLNFIALDLFQRIGEEIKIPKLISHSASLERSLNCSINLDFDFNTVYCDLDDCLIIDNKVNKKLVTFLYQCLNKNKKLVLITRHEIKPAITLNKYRLSNLFDRVVHIKDRSVSKAEFITDKSAIFVDDSFQEREKVSDLKGIPVFAPDAIELLITEHFD
ncbi:MAG: ATP-grasp domain-containing protein [Gracilimonas sp.]|uniref:ATP-grasp domain-containing protein n=1 Tax=Gracilimonas sp. TaxID=1974203 RepID=UPI00199FAA09|nr:ATP-grasp domain-containing protein [Gracilimonas sp.]MBD3616871.1 ATP-grasp domain-containing protein [Gracilimonas sp.]